jgi:hypothetical protein
MANPYTGSAQIHLQPYPGEFFANLAERGAQRDEKFDDLMSKVATTHIPVMPGVDTDKQQQYEAKVKSSLSTIADQLAKNQIDPRTAHRGVMDTYNQLVNDPGVLKRQQSYTNFQEGKKIKAELNSKGEYLPEINQGFEGYMQHDSEQQGAFQTTPVGPQNYDAYGNNVWDNIGSAVSTDPNEIRQQGLNLGESTKNTPAAKTFELLHPGKSWNDFIIQKGLERQNLLPKVDRGKQPETPASLQLAPVPGPGIVDPTDEKLYQDYNTFKSTVSAAKQQQNAVYSKVDMNGPTSGASIANADESRFFKQGDDYFNYRNFNENYTKLMDTEGLSLQEAMKKAMSPEFNDNEQYDNTVGAAKVQADGLVDLQTESQRQIISNVRNKFGATQFDKLVKDGVIDPNTGEVGLSTKFNKEIEDKKKQLLETGRITIPNAGGDSYQTRKYTEAEAQADAEQDVYQHNPILNKLRKTLNDETVTYGTSNLKYYNGLGLPQKEDFTKGDLDANETTMRSLYDSWNSSIFNGSGKTFSINNSDDNSGKLTYASFNQNEGKDFAKDAGLKEEDLKSTEFVPKSIHITDGRGLVVLGNMKGSNKQIGLDLTGDQESYAMNILYPRGTSNTEMSKLLKAKLGDDQMARNGKINVQGTDINIQRLKNQEYRVSLNNPYTKKWEQQEVPTLEQAADLVNRTLSFGNDVKVGGALEQLQKTVEDPNNKGYNPNSSAVGPYQVLFDGNKSLIDNTAKQLGIRPPQTKEDFAANQPLYNQVAQVLMSESISNAYNASKEAPDFTVGNLTSLFYYLGDRGAKKWLKVYTDTKDHSKADATIPGYPKTNMSGYDYMMKSNLNF